MKHAAAQVGKKKQALRGLDELQYYFYIEGDATNPAINKCTMEALSHLQYTYYLGDVVFNSTSAVSTDDSGVGIAALGIN